MTNVITFLRDYEYDLCLVKRNKWTLEEAVDYIATYQANKLDCSTREEAYGHFLNVRKQILKLLLLDIDEHKLNFYPEFKDKPHGDERLEIDMKKSAILPIIFIKWALENDIEVPKQFETYAAKDKKHLSQYYEAVGIKTITIHHERSRAVAELLWSKDPEIPIAEMARRSEIIQFGCQGYQYDTRTISRWLFTLVSDRKLGRRKKKE